MGGFYLWFFWLGIMAAPALALTLYCLWNKNARRMHYLLMASAAFLIITLSALMLRLSFFSHAANLSWVLISYTAYSFMVWNALRISSKWVKLPILIIGNLPVLAGYLLSTIGIMFLFIIILDMTDTPVRVERPSAGHICIAKAWTGGALSDDGYTNTLYAYPVWLPVIRQEINSLHHNESHPERGSPNTRCTDVMAARK